MDRLTAVPSSTGQPSNKFGCLRRTGRVRRGYFPQPLTERTVRTMLMFRLKTAAALALVVSLLGGGAALVTYRA